MVKVKWEGLSKSHWVAGNDSINYNSVLSFPTFTHSNYAIQICPNAFPPTVKEQVKPHSPSLTLTPSAGLPPS